VSADIHFSRICVVVSLHKEWFLSGIPWSRYVCSICL